MPYYHDSKEAALAAGKPYEGFWDTRASLEPHNGWVLILTPKTKEVFQWPLQPLLDVAEIDLTGISRLYKRPPEHKAMEPLPKKVAKVPKDYKPSRDPNPQPKKKNPWEL